MSHHNQVIAGVLLSVVCLWAGFATMMWFAWRTLCKRSQETAAKAQEVAKAWEKTAYMASDGAEEWIALAKLQANDIKENGELLAQQSELMKQAGAELARQRAEIDRLKAKYEPEVRS